MTVWIGTSWKMNKTAAEAAAFTTALAADKHGDARIRRFVIPPFVYLREVHARLQGSPVMLGAQNIHWEDAGAWTGEISAVMVKDCGGVLAEIGHSERRMHFGETDKTVGLKTAAAIRHGLIPLICIGETLEQKESGKAGEVLAAQVRAALGNLDDKQKSAEILFAYEPVWAIGEGGVPATADYADARHAEIMETAAAILGRKVPCLYGGSVNGDNCAELIQCAHIDGLFIGRAAWDVAGYKDILQKCSAVI